MKISVIILARNSEDKIRDCIESVDWAHELMVIDTGSTDETPQIAKRLKAKVFAPKGSFSDWRNFGASKAEGEWLLYVDADERVTPLLRREIESAVRGPAPGFPPASARHSPARVSGSFPPVSPLTSVVAFAIPRRNFVFGKELRHGGWYPDYVIRLFKKENLVKWRGELHEQPQFSGEIGYLKEPLIHLKEDNLSDMVLKTNKWSEIEAKLIYRAGHPKMSWWRFFRVILTEVFDRLILKRGFLDGAEGVIFSIYQGWSKFVTYGKLWEFQEKSKTLNSKLKTNPNLKF